MAPLVDKYAGVREASNSGNFRTSHEMVGRAWRDNHVMIEVSNFRPFPAASLYKQHRRCVMVPGDGTKIRRLMTAAAKGTFLQ